MSKILAMVFLLSWQEGSTNRVTAVLASTNLAGPYETIGYVTNFSNTNLTFAVTNDDKQKFYKVGVKN